MHLIIIMKVTCIGISHLMNTIYMILPALGISVASITTLALLSGVLQFSNLRLATFW